jgi:hypothetical protein
LLEDQGEVMTGDVHQLAEIEAMGAEALNA